MGGGAGGVELCSKNSASAPWKGGLTQHDGIHRTAGTELNQNLQEWKQNQAMSKVCKGVGTIFCKGLAVRGGEASTRFWEEILALPAFAIDYTMDTSQSIGSDMQQTTAGILRGGELCNIKFQHSLPCVCLLKPKESADVSVTQWGRKWVNFFFFFLAQFRNRKCYLYCLFKILCVISHLEKSSILLLF